jgi:pimeloyl-ACP methyl ester carboxylesterase
MRPGHRILLLAVSLAAPVVGACAASGTDSTSVASPHDGGATDTGTTVDSGTVRVPVESGTPASSGNESGPGTDAATGDAPGDAADTGITAQAADTPIVACTDIVSDVYVTPSGLPAMDMNARGAIIRCARDSSLAVSDVTAAFASASVGGVTPTTGVDIYRIEYRTFRDDGVPGASTARVYLPHTPRSLPLPIIAVAHPTEGLAPSCVPSASPTSLEDEALPWAASGFAVIASDYAGLGNEGVQGYLDNHDQAHSMLDSARALRAMLAPGVFDHRVLLVGYSQGGGAVLASQGLASSYGAGGNVVGVVVFAAEYFARMNSLQFVTTLQSPTNLTITSGVTVPVVAATRDYAFSYNVLGADAGGATFPEGGASGIEGALMSLCEVPFGGYIQGVAPHLGDLFDEGFRSSLLACIQGTGGCSGLGSQYYQWLQSDLIAPDPAGAPILYVQGLSDTIMPPAQEAACNIGQLLNAGVSVQVCTDQAAQHTDIVARNVAFALQWSDRVLYGGAMPTCSSAGMPTCQP